MDLATIALRVVVALVVIVAAVWFVQKRFGSRAPRAQKALRIVSRQGVGARASVVMLDADGKRFLLGVSERGVTVLHTSDHIDEVPQSFDEALESASSTRPERAPELVRFRVPGDSALAGSLLSGETWRRALTALRAPR